MVDHISTRVLVGGGGLALVAPCTYLLMTRNRWISAPRCCTVAPKPTWSGYFCGRRRAGKFCGLYEQDAYLGSRCKARRWWSFTSSLARVGWSHQIGSSYNVISNPSPWRVRKGNRPFWKASPQGCGRGVAVSSTAISYEMCSVPHGPRLRSCRRRRCGYLCCRLLQMSPALQMPPRLVPSMSALLLLLLLLLRHCGALTPPRSPPTFVWFLSNFARYDASHYSKMCSVVST